MKGRVSPGRGRLRRLGAGALGLARRAVELFPLTPLGLLASAGAALALSHYGVGRLDLVLLVVGAATLGASALALVCVVGSALGLALGFARARRRAKRAAAEAEGASEPAAANLGRLRLECGARTETGFSLPRLGWVPFVRLGAAWASPGGVVLLEPGRAGARGRLLEKVKVTRRALRDGIRRRVDVSDAFGFCRVTLRPLEARGVVALPNVGALRRVDVARSFASGDDVSHPLGPPEGDRADMRAYASGDPTRLILWKVFAKSRELVVRTPERALSPARKTCAYLVCGPGDEPSAAAARVAVESGALGTSWVLGVDGSDEFATTLPKANELLCRSGDAEREAHGAGLAPFLRRHAPEPGARVVVFVPPRPGPWLDRVLAAAKSPGASRLAFVIGVDGLRRTGVRSALVKIATRRPEGEATPTEELAEVTSALARTRAKVVVLDRKNGRILAAPTSAPAPAVQGRGGAEKAGEAALEAAR